MSSLLHRPPILHGLIPGFREGSPAAGGDGWSAGNTLLFDGINDFVTLDADIVLTGDFTLSFWFNAASFVAMPISNDVDHNYIYLPSAGTTRFHLGGSSTNYNFTYPNLLVDTWYNTFFFREGSNGRLFVNGVESATGVLAMNALTVTWRLIGTHSSGALTWDGNLDDFYIWDGVVGTPQNSIDIYNSGTPVDPESVIAAADYKYRFNSSDGSRLIDSGASVNSGDLTNFADPDSNWVSRL